MGNFFDNIRTRRWWMNALSLLFCALVVANICVIYAFSAESSEQSSDRSEGVADSIAGIIVDGYHEMESNEQQVYIDKIHSPLRKFAHFSLFACLGSLTTIFIYSLGLKKWYFTIVVPLGFGILNAIFDELHQMYSAGRVSDITDILIDFAGVAIAVAIVNLSACLIFRYAPKKQSDIV